MGVQKKYLKIHSKIIKELDKLFLKILDQWMLDLTGTTNEESENLRVQNRYPVLSRYSTCVYGNQNHLQYRDIPVILTL